MRTRLSQHDAMRTAPVGQSDEAAHRADAGALPEAGNSASLRSIIVMRVPIRLSAVRARGSQEAGRQSRGVEFASDSPLEGAGFEPSVPRVTGSGDTVPGAAAGAALVHGPGCIAHNNIDPLERPVELN